MYVLLISSVAFWSCDRETFDLEPQSKETFEAKLVSFEGEVQNSENARAPGIFSCGVTGLDCGLPNQSLTYTYTTTTSNPIITWTVMSGDISLSSPQGTNTATFLLGNNFNGGTIKVLGAGSPNCTVIFDILECSGTPACGIDVIDVFELNQLGSNDVVFYATSNLSPGSTVTSSFFTVTYQDNSTSNHVGYTNFLGNQQIIIPVICSQNKVRKVKATIYAVSNSGVYCSDSQTHDWGTVGVCGTGGFN